MTGVLQGRHITCKCQCWQ